MQTEPVTPWNCQPVLTGPAIPEGALQKLHHYHFLNELDVQKAMSDCYQAGLTNGTAQADVEVENLKNQLAQARAAAVTRKLRPLKTEQKIEAPQAPIETAWLNHDVSVGLLIGLLTSLCITFVAHVLSRRNESQQLNL